MAKTDFYELLGVDKSASAAGLKSAYRKQAKKYHPDVNPGDLVTEQKFKEISEAYDVLKDEQTRAAYDQYGHAAFENGGGAGGSGTGGFGGMGDIFEEFFGGRRQRGHQQQRGGDLRAEVEITLEEAFAGTERQINMTRAAPCDSCSGSGAKAGSQAITCTTCQGHGKVRAQQGFFMVERTCHNCQGSGQIITDPCGACDGRGHVQQQRNLSVSIPAGVEDGTRIRLSGEGDVGQRGSVPGDLYVFVHLRPHSFLQRDGADLFCTMPVKFDLAARGGALHVPLLDSKKVSLSVPEGAQTGQQFRLRSKGMPVLRKRMKGDLYVQIEVEVPSGLNAKQQALLDNFTESLDDRNFPNVADFSSRSQKSQ